MNRNMLSLMVAMLFGAKLGAAPAGGGTAVADAKAKLQLPEGWTGLATDVSKKVTVVGGGNEYQKVGDIIIPVPTLEAFGLTPEHRARTEDDGEDDGLPLYKNDEMQWLQDAVVAQCKAQARNKLVSGTADLKDGQKIAENFAELTAEGERRGNAEALKLAKEIVQSFGAFVQTLGKTAQTQAVLHGLFRNKQALALQTDENKAKMKGYLAQYAETLTEADLTRYSKYLNSVEEACAAGTPSDF